MMVPMTPEAVRCFRILTELSLVLEVIDEDVFDQRLEYLCELLDGSDSTTDGIDEARMEVSVEEASREKAHDELIRRTAAGGGTPPDWVQFIPGGPIAHLKRWQFIKGDPDPLPSVPHAHDEGRAFPKLDPYLGWIHTSTRQTSGRLGKDDTRALWNHDGFRDFASAALVHFAQENPGFVWRVPYPMRLPRRH